MNCWHNSKRVSGKKRVICSIHNCTLIIRVVNRGLHPLSFQGGGLSIRWGTKCEECLLETIDLYIRGMGGGGVSPHNLPSLPLPCIFRELIYFQGRKNELLPTHSERLSYSVFNQVCKPFKINVYLKVRR